MSDEVEMWRDIPDYVGLYEASNLGRVRSLPRTVPTVNKAMGVSTRVSPGRIMKLNFNRRAKQQTVTLTKNGDQKVFKVAHLVLFTFVGPRPGPKDECCHFPDRGTTNNRLSNLRWDTRLGNIEDQKIHGTTRLGKVGPQGVRNAKAKLNDEQVVEMRRRYQTGVSSAKLAAEFGLGKSATHAILTGKNWRHVLPPGSTFST